MERDRISDCGMEAKSEAAGKCSEARATETLKAGYFQSWKAYETRAVSFPRCWRPARANSKRQRAALASRSAPPGRKYTSPHRLQTQAWIPVSRTRTPSLSNSCATLRGRSRPPHSEHGFLVSSIIASVHASRV